MELDMFEPAGPAAGQAPADARAGRPPPARAVFASGTRAPSPDSEHGIAFDLPGWHQAGPQEPAAGSARTATASLLADLEELEDGPPPAAEAGPPPPGADQLQTLPEDLLLRLLGLLSAADLLSCRQASRSLHRIASGNALWARHSPAHAEPGQQADATPDPGYQDLRWLSQLSGSGTIIVRSNRAAARAQQVQALRSKFREVALAGDRPADGVELYLACHLHVADRLDAKLLSLWRSHVSMRVALCDLWLGRELDLAWLRCVILQLTRLSWATCYEALVGAFHQVCDAVALQLQARDEAAAAWPPVLALWQQFAAWLDRVTAACALLCSCVSAERTAEWIARGRPDTPPLADAGRLAWKSQVMLRFGLRARLQAELPGLGPGRLRQARAVLRELDVADDGTASAALHTQDVFRAAFGLDRM